MKLILLAALISFNLISGEIEVYTNEEPPYQFLDENNEPSGLSIEIVQLLLKKVESKAKINVWPWVRVKNTKLNQPNVLIFTAVRNSQTEKEYQWVGHLVDYKIAVYKLKSRDDISVSRLADMKKYTIGVVNGGGRHRFFTEKGFTKNIKGTTSTYDEQNISRFYGKRFDLLPEDPVIFHFSSLKSNFDPNKAVKIFEIKELESSGQVAFTLNTPKFVVDKFRDALVEVKKTKKFSEILQKYGLD